MCQPLRRGTLLLVFTELLARAWALDVRGPYQVHAFYYLWYGEPATDGRYQHWDHEVLSHWDTQVAKQWPQGVRFEPPGCLHSPYYPLRGPYSSRSRELIRQHLQEMWAHGIGVLVASWWGPAHREGATDTQQINTDERVAEIEQEILDSGIPVRLAFHLEPYPGRTKETVQEDLQYLANKYRDSPAVFRLDDRLVYYVYDSYRLPASDWADLLKPDGDLSVRGTLDDGFFIGLWLNREDGPNSILAGGFDGAYTYFASEAVSFGANPNHWSSMLKWAQEHGLLFVPSIGPGYNDSKIRPWNAAATRDRQDGNRYRNMWSIVTHIGSRVVSLTSYNEWGEGTQIEPAVHRPAGNGCSYHSYEPGGPLLYLNITKEGSDKLAHAWRCGEHGGTCDAGSEVPGDEVGTTAA